MALFDKHLFVKKSTLPNAGKGLFTRIFIPKGAKITEYKGEVLTWKEVEKMADYRNGYVFYFNKNYVIDAWKTKKGVAHFANDARGITRVAGVRNNAEYDTEKKRCYIVATRDIPAGSEIFVSYGAEYWQVIRYNIRLDEKNAAKANKTNVELPHHHAAKRIPKHRYTTEIPTSSARGPKR
jgi:SET domain-containing protein